eukprot:366414-Chlamydomonas_euryale.AAC.9
MRSCVSQAGKEQGCGVCVCVCVCGFGWSRALRSVAEDGRVEQLTLRQCHRNVEVFLGWTALERRGAQRKILVEALLFRT